MFLDLIFWDHVWSSSISLLIYPYMRYHKLAEEVGKFKRGYERKGINGKSMNEASFNPREQYQKACVERKNMGN